MAISDGQRARWTPATMAVAAVLALAACSSTGGTAAPPQSSSAEVPSSNIASPSDDSPTAAALVCAPPPSGGVLQHVDSGTPGVRIGVIQPAGWHRDSSIDSALIRFGQVADQRAASAVITVDRLPQFTTTQQVFDFESNGFTTIGGGRNLRSRPDTVCGLPAQTVTVDQPADALNPPRVITARTVAVQVDRGFVAVSLVVQPLTRPADVPTRRDLTAIVDSLQVTAPGTGT